jgi:hypothetical protein
MKVPFLFASKAAFPGWFFAGKHSGFAQAEKRSIIKNILM